MDASGLIVPGKKPSTSNYKSDARENRRRDAMVLVLVLAANGFCIAVYVSINCQVRLGRNRW